MRPASAQAEPSFVPLTPDEEASTRPEIDTPAAHPATIQPPAESAGADHPYGKGFWSEAALPSDLPLPFSAGLPPYPVELNRHVQRFLDLFQSEGKRVVVERWLHKSGRYLGMIRDVLRQKGLPEELAYIAMIESGFNPVAVSRAGAKGLWQFMESTGRRYGLRIDRWVDERLDPLKSTLAAAEHLRDLFAQFGSWFLAQAAYNAGELKVARAVQVSQSDDFWTIAGGRVLKEETKRFVPAIQAATLISREPERYGFDVTPALPEPYDVVTVPFSLELSVIAKWASIAPHVLTELNPELLRSATPPDGPYPLRVPLGSAEQIRERLKDLTLADAFHWSLHHVKKGQTLRDVARIHRTTPSRLVEINRLASSSLRSGTELVVPVLPPTRAVAFKGRSEGKPGEPVHVVRPGETLSGIARGHGVALDELLRWNGLARASRIHPGTRLKVTGSSLLAGAADK